MNILIFLEMIGGLVLFLYGIQYLGDSLKKVSGGRLEKILETLTSNKWKGALLGMLVTAVIQSSGATIVMCVGFVNSGIMSLSQSVGVILGANIGTTITAWLLSLSGITSDNVFIQLFKPENFSPIVGLVGLIMVMAGRKQRHKDVGAILLSFAILLIGMSTMSSAVSPLADDPAFTGMMTAFSNPLLGLLVGLGMTAILQSSSASIGILQAISTSGTLTMGSSIPIIMGENIGSAITGIISSVGASRNAKRAAWIQMFYCIIKTTVFMIVFYTLNAFIHFPIMEQTASPVRIAIFHSVFNIAAVLVMLPFSELLVKIVTKVFPITEEEKEQQESMHTFSQLDQRFLSSPGLALDQSKTVILQMARHARDSMNLAMDLIFTYDESQAKEVSRLEELVDEYEDQLDSYLTLIAGRDLTEQESHLLSTLVHSTNDIERISDHALNVMQSVTRMQEDDQKFTKGTLAELRIFTDAIREILELTFKAMEDNDFEMARRVDPLEDTIDGLDIAIKENHVRRLQNGECTIEMGIVLDDITIDLERVADHCSNMALYMLSSQVDNFDTHLYSQKEREAQDSEYLTLEEEYQAKYALPKPEKIKKKKKDKDKDNKEKDNKDKDGKGKEKDSKKKKS